MDKLFRHVNAELWQKVKAQAALERITLKAWVEKALEKALEQK